MVMFLSRYALKKKIMAFKLIYLMLMSTEQVNESQNKKLKNI